MVSGGITPTPTYDGNGNQKTATPATLTWNALNQPITVNSTTATYDALGRMVEEIGDMIPISTPQKIFSRVLQFNSRKRAQLNHGSQNTDQDAPTTSIGNPPGSDSLHSPHPSPTFAAPR